MIQIINTYKCNLRCDHCLLSCGPKMKGFISMRHVKMFLEKYGYDYVNYCGGETFLHPNWKDQIATIASSLGKYGYIRVVSNGTPLVTKNYNPSKKLRDFIDLAALYRDVEFSLMISDDTFHEEELAQKGIDIRSVIEAVRYTVNDYYLSNVTVEEDTRRRMPNKVIPIGRALTTGCYDHNGNCFLDKNYPDNNLTIDPYGNLFACCNAVGYIGHIEEDQEEVRKRLKVVRYQSSCLDCKLKKRDEVLRRKWILIEEAV